MKNPLKILQYSLAAALFCCFSACVENAIISEDEVRFTKPFLKTDTVIYQSSTGLIDTIMFYQAMNDTVKGRAEKTLRPIPLVNKKRLYVYI